MTAAVLGAFGALLTGLIVWMLRILQRMAQDVRVLRFALFGNGEDCSQDRQGTVPVLDVLHDLRQRVAALEEARKA